MSPLIVAWPHPDRVQSQMEGSVVFGLSLAMMGGVTMSRGQVNESNFHDAPVARIADANMPIRVTILPSQALPGESANPECPPWHQLSAMPLPRRRASVFAVSPSQIMICLKPRHAGVLAPGRSVSTKRKHCVLALVMRTWINSPKKGAQMVISEDHAMGTIGGGIGERQLIHVCQSLLKSGNTHQSLQLALDGEPAAPGMGICGGVMDLALWVIPAGTDLFAQSAAWHAQGKPVTWGLSAEEVSFPVQ